MNLEIVTTAPNRGLGLVSGFSVPEWQYNLPGVVNLRGDCSATLIEKNGLMLMTGKF